MTENDLDCMATEVDTILGGTSSFYDKRMRQVSSLIAFLLNKFIPCNFNYINNNHISLITILTIKILFTINSL